MELRRFGVGQKNTGVMVELDEDDRALNPIVEGGRSMKLVYACTREGSQLGSTRRATVTHNVRARILCERVQNASSSLPSAV
jgi:hypothetical protein